MAKVNFAEASNYFELANKFIQQKNYENAIQNLSHAIEIYPNAAKFYDSRSYCYLKLKKFDLCMLDVCKTLEFQAYNANCYIRAAYISILNGKLNDAIEWIRKANKLNKQSFYMSLRIRYLIGKFQHFKNLFDNQQYFQAYDAIEELLKIESNCRYYELLKALCLVHMEKYREASNIIEKFVFGDTSCHEICAVFYIDALLLYYKGELSSASFYSKESISLTDDQDMINKISELLEKSKYIEESIQNVNIAMDEKKYLKALATCNEAIQIDPRNKAVSNMLHFLRGKIYMSMENFADAIKDFSTSLTYDASDVQALLMRSECFGKLKKIEDHGKELINVLQSERKQKRKQSVINPNKNVGDEMHEKCQECCKNCGKRGSFEISFIPKENTNLTISRTINGEKTFYPFENVPKSEFELNTFNDGRNIVYKLKLFDQD